MTKFYAVKIGRKVGIYTSWDKCKEQVNGFPNALYKSFASYKEAEVFIGKKDLISDFPEKIDNEPIADITAYIDGSYEDSKKVYGYAGIMFLKNEERIEFAHADSDIFLIELRNVAGEIKAAMYVIDFALKNKAKSIYIHYDYAGIENWANKSWKAKKAFTQEYVQFIDEAKTKINIYFKKIKSHSGDKYNEEVDLLAKKAIENFKKVNETTPSFEEEYVEILNQLNATKKSVNLHLMIENEVYDSDRIYRIFKSKWKSKGRKLKDIVDLKTLLDIKGEHIVFKVNTNNREEILKFDLKEFKENG